MGVDNGPVSPNWVEKNFLVNHHNYLNKKKWMVVRAKNHKVHLTIFVCVLVRLPCVLKKLCKLFLDNRAVNKTPNFISFGSFI